MKASQTWDEYWAHTPRNTRDANTRQTMRDHVLNVAQMAAGFAVSLGVVELAHWCGLLHDVGKYSDAFQQYLRACHDAALKGKPAPPAGSAEHKTAGAKMALVRDKDLICRMLAGCVLGHHGGLPAGREIGGLIATHGNEEEKEIAIGRARSDLSQLVSSIPLPSEVPITAMLTGPNTKDQHLGIEMLMRLVFSCLVDADALDTEAHFDPRLAQQRKSKRLADLAGSWLDRVKYRVESLQAKQQDGLLRQVRSGVFEASLNAAEIAPGLFTLTVPTGGGKTLSSLAFALRHAVAHTRSRIIYAIPYTSIVEQTARVFSEVLGRQSVLEHHSGMDWRTAESKQDDEAAQDLESTERSNRFAAENWDAPLIVTTTVQLFESLFSNRPSRCRKLHNLADSVIILDEVQTLPLHLLQPLVSGLAELLRLCNATIVLCTATQPALTGQSPLLKGLPAPTPIISDPEPHFTALSRVTYRIETDPWDWKRGAAEMTDSGRSCMAVLNTKKDALALLQELANARGEVRHLSTLLCGAHRQVILDEVKALLKAERNGGRPVYLTATQLIEAGVDIDFPRVLRAKGPLDRMIQAAGRCNREGRRSREESEVVLFVPTEGSAPPGDYDTAIRVAWNRLTGPGGPPDLNAPGVATDYFAELYSYVGEKGLDRKEVQQARRTSDFPTVADRVRLIEDDTIPVLVPFCRPQHPAAPIGEDEFHQLIDTIRSYGMTRDRWREIQPLTVAVRRHEAERLMKETLLEILVQDQLYLWYGRYDPLTGIGGIVAHAVEDLIV